MVSAALVKFSLRAGKLQNLD